MTIIPATVIINGITRGLAVSHQEQIGRYVELAKILRKEQKRLIDEAIEYGSVPSNGILRQIAELELNISAVDNSIAEMKE
jgi:hypothetical protein